MSLQEFILTVIGLCVLLALTEMYQSSSKSRHIYDPHLDARHDGRDA